MFDGGTVRQPDELNNKRTGYDSRRQFLTASEAHVFNPQLLNSLRFGLYRVVATTGLTFLAGNPAAAAGVAGWGLLANQYSPAAFQSRFGPLETTTPVSWLSSLTLFVASAVMAIRSVRWAVASPVE